MSNVGVLDAVGPVATHFDFSYSNRQDVRRIIRAPRESDWARFDACAKNISIDTIHFLVKTEA